MLNRLLTRRRFKLPSNLLGADLFWWRESADLHTLVTIYPPELSAEETKGMKLTFVLFDRDGQARTRWEQPLLRRHTVSIDSSRLREYIEEEVDPREFDGGMLAAFVTTEGTAPKALKEQYQRLYSLIDWYSEDGTLVSLHNDQSVIADERAIEFTEIVFCETEADRNFLVLLNGNDRQEAGSVVLETKNHQGATRQGIYHPSMEPFTVHRLDLDELFNGLVEFCDGRHATISGVFNCQGLFTRPYVMTKGRRLCGYHGGDRYDWEGLPAVRYDHLGRGQMNPMAVLMTDDVQTAVNIFNTHGHVEDDFWIDARVYDDQGALLVERERWLLARRHELARGEIADLLPDRATRVVGYVALSYAPADVPLYPGTVQALMEYRSGGAAARVMAWADDWNSPDRLAARGAPLRREFYRIANHDLIESHLSITNCGLVHAYAEHADYAVILNNSRGETLRWEGRLAPHATMFAPIEQLFPNVREFLGPDAAGTAIVESTYDLAIVQFSRHRRSGVYSAEHAMSLMTYHEGRPVRPCGW